MASLAEVLTQLPMVAYAGVLIFLLWLASVFNCASFWLFVIAFLFLFEVDRNYTKKLRREIRTEERRSAYQSRPLSDFESAEWINEAIEKLWPSFLERCISQEILKPMIPWFLDKHKPWTVRKAILQRLELGRAPPRFLGARTLDKTSGDDHLVMDLCLDFAAAEDMIAVLSVQMRRRLGLGIRTNINISRLHIEGKVRVGVKFSNAWPFISRVRACFENAPYVQLTARPLSEHGVNVSELPLIAGYMERMVADVFEQSLVEPNMLVLDIEKLFRCVTPLKTTPSSMQDKWYDVQEKAATAILHLKILEASDLKPSDPNGLADPFVRGSFATCKFKTRVQRKTLKPKWFEEFEVPVASWELSTLLVLHVRDKDQFRDDDLGYCEIDIKKFRDGMFHDLWLPLQSVKMGRLHISLSITEDDTGSSCRDSLSKRSELTDKQQKAETNDVDPKSPVEERFEFINLGKGQEGFVSIVSPGQPLRSKSWQQRQGIKRRDSVVNQKDIVESVLTESSSSDEAGEQEFTKTKKPRKRRLWGRRAPQQVNSLDILKPETPSPEHGNEYVAVGTKGTTVRMKLEGPSDGIGGNDLDDGQANETPTPHEGNAVPASPSKKEHMKSMAKGFVKHAGKTAHSLGSALNRKGSGKKKGKNEDGVEDSRISASETRPADEKATESRLSDEGISEPRVSGEQISVSDGKSESLDDRSLNGSGFLHDKV